MLKISFLRNTAITSSILLFTACSGSSYKKLYPEGAGLTALPATAEVYITASVDAPKCKITKIADLKVASKTYGGAARVNNVVRKMARDKGGNAVIGYKFWVAPNGFAWAAPQCEGTVVSADLACLKKVSTPVSETD